MASRLVRAVGVLHDPLLADLTVEGVMAGDFGLNPEQLASRGYERTQQVSGQIHAMRDADDSPLFEIPPSRLLTLGSVPECAARGAS